MRETEYAAASTIRRRLAASTHNTAARVELILAMRGIVVGATASAVSRAIRPPARRLSRLGGFAPKQFAPDSALEGTGFEPSVPCDTTKFSTPAIVTYAWFPARGKVGANDNRHHEDAGRLPRNPRGRGWSLIR
jgi:hypothetical protein